MADLDVIVVGGGISGLIAAYELCKEDLSVLVLEAKDRVGGRTMTTSIRGHTGDVPCDVGGQWVSSSQPNILSVINELGLKTFRQYTAGRHLLQLRDAVPASYTGNIPFCLNIFTSISLAVLFAVCEYLIKLPLPELQAQKPHAFDQLTLGQVARNYALSSSVGQMLSMMTRVVFGSEPDRLSFLYFLHYAKCAGSLDRLLDAEKDGAQELKVVGGTQQISTRLAELIGEERVVCNQPVLAINQEEETVNVTTLHGFVYHAKRVIMATPPQQLTHITWTPALPGWRSQALSWLPMGHLIKIIVTYEKPFWRNKGLSGSAISNNGTLCCIFDCTFPDDTAYGLVGFFGGDDAIYWNSRSKSERQEAVLSTLTEMFGDEAADCITYEEKDWAEEPYNGGCPVASMPPGIMTLWEGRAHQVFDRVHFAGTETASVWCGYMDGAVESGRRAASEVVSALLKPPGATSTSSQKRQPNFHPVQTQPAQSRPTERVTAANSSSNNSSNSSSNSSTQYGAASRSAASVCIMAATGFVLLRSLGHP